MRRKKSLAVMMTVIMCCTVLFPAGSIRTQAASTKQEVQSTLTISKEQEAQSTLTVSKEQEVQSTPSAFQSKDAKNIDVTTAKDGVVQQKKQSTKKTKKAQTSSKKTSGSKKTTEILDTDVSKASKGCTLYGAYGTFYSQAQKALDQINQYRKEACEEGDVPDPRNPTRMLTPSDYVPLKWSTDLERIARIRAAEAGYAFRFMDTGHMRLNGKDTFSVTSNGLSRNSEDLSYYYKMDGEDAQMREGVLLWYMEKKGWLNREDISNGTEVRHYTSIINPSYIYIGLGCFYNEDVPYPVTLAGELSRKGNTDRTMLEEKHNVIQKIEVQDGFLKETELDVEDSMKTDETVQVAARAWIQNESGHFSKNKRRLYMLGIDEYVSSDPSVAGITSDGELTTHKKGVITITARSNGKDILSKRVTIECGHRKRLRKYTDSTCTTEGIKQFYCPVCEDTENVTIEKKAHDYVYGDTDSNGLCTGVCSVCQDTITINPPKSCKFSWLNMDRNMHSYEEEFPEKNETGDTISCFATGVDGDPAYREMVIESSEESVIAVRNQLSANSSSDALTIKGHGITQISVYPKYNKSLGKNYLVRIGQKEEISIKEADVYLEKDEYTYQNAYCTPQAGVYYNTTKLTEGVDYTVHYENNFAAGTAYAVIEGKGLFYGTIKEAFTIHPSVTQEHMHQAVTDPAIAAGCMTVGYTQGSHCTVCGQTINEQKVIEAAGHRYENGVCTVCGDIQYIEENGLRYTLQEDINGKKTLQVSAADGVSLSGEITIPATVTIANTSYSVITVAKNGFAGQSAITAVSLPKTLKTIESRAFAGCTGLTQMSFYSQKAPDVQKDSWENRGDSTLTFVVHLTGYGYDSIAEIANATVDRTLKHIHSLEFQKGKAATCTEPGMMDYYHCIDCGKYYLDENATMEIVMNDAIIYPLGHDWNSTFTIDIPATATTAGEKSLHCKRCGQRSRITVIPAGGSNDPDGNDSGWDDSRISNTTDSSASSTKQASTVTKNTVKKGSIFTSKNLRYKVLSTSKKTVACIGTSKKTITSVTIPAKVTYSRKSYTVTQITDLAFAFCGKLKTVTIGDKVATVGRNAFYRCKSLQKAVIGKKVKKIGFSAFAYCPKLKKIQLKSKLLKNKNVGYNVFKKCKKNAAVKVPSGKKKEYRKWFKKTGISLR